MMTDSLGTSFIHALHTRLPLPLKSVCAALSSSIYKRVCFGRSTPPVRCVGVVYTRQYNYMPTFATMARVFVALKLTNQNLVRPRSCECKDSAKEAGQTCLDPRNLACTLVPGFEAGCTGL